MNDAAAMCVVDCPRDADRYQRGIPFVYRARPQLIRQRTALDKFHREKRRALDVPDFINLDDVWVTTSPGGLRFCEESCELVRRVMAGQHFQRDDPVQRNLARTINHAHSAAAQLALDFVIAHDVIDRERLRAGMRCARVRHGAAHLPNFSRATQGA